MHTRSMACRLTSFQRQPGPGAWLERIARNTAVFAGVIGGMHPSKLGTLVAILATATGFSALAPTAEAQISGSTGGDTVAQHRAPAFDDPFFFPTGGIVAAEWVRK
jgi:hypothetical protein